MGMGFAVSEPHGGKAKTHVWLTPKNIIQKLGPFDLDPCGFEGHETAKNYFYEESDGLSKTWDGLVWMNPPYGEFTPTWMDKLAKHGNGIALVFSRTDVAWFQKAMKMADAVFFKKGRIKFISNVGVSKNSAGAGSCFFAFGTEAVTRLKRLDDGILVNLK